MTRTEIFTKYRGYFIEAPEERANTECYIVTSYLLDDEGEQVPYLAIAEIRSCEYFRFCRMLKRNGHYSIHLRRFDEDDFKDELAALSWFAR